MNTGLAGRKVLITGAATGIGRATALAFAEEGAELALLDIDRSQLEETARGLREGTRTTVVVADLSTKDGVEVAFETAVHGLGGRLDVLFNNVGSGAVRGFDDLDDQAWQKTFDLNFFSVVRATRTALDLMRKQGAE